jgi:prolyl 4-hydroxylase
MKESTVGSTQKMSETRTSSTVWLKDPECQDPLRLIAEKVSMISGLPPTNMENLQVVKYEPGQEFNMHTDHMESFK